MRWTCDPRLRTGICLRRAKGDDQSKRLFVGVYMSALSWYTFLDCFIRHIDLLWDVIAFGVTRDARMCSMVCSRMIRLARGLYLAG